MTLLPGIADARRDLTLSAFFEATMADPIFKFGPNARKSDKLNELELAVMESAKVLRWSYNAPMRQGLTLVHFSAQPEPFLTQ